MIAFYSVTPTERQLIRDDFLLDENTFVKFWRNNDGTWAGEVGITGVVVEGHSSTELLRAMADILEEL